MSKFDQQRLVPRYPLPKEKIKFIFGEFEKVFAVRDISSNGLGISLLEYGEALLFPPDYQCKAELKLDDKPMVVGVRVTRVNAWAVGLVFEELSPEQRKQIDDFIDPIHIAGSLKKVDQNSAPDAYLQGISSWYHGDSGTDLFLWTGSQGELSRALFCLGVNYWEWDEGLGVSTGEIQRLQGDRLVMNKAVTPDPKVCLSVRKILEQAEVLDYRLVSFLKART